MQGRRPGKTEEELIRQLRHEVDIDKHLKDCSGHEEQRMRLHVQTGGVASRTRPGAGFKIGPCARHPLGPGLWSGRGLPQRHDQDSHSRPHPAFPTGSRQLGSGRSEYANCAMPGDARHRYFSQP
ncbi:hypothetical protein GCM10010342_52850 [Streptomyces anulatus]|nr:hypothetical protein GCM10010342_52850 [Streptomyces anulatus]